MAGAGDWALVTGASRATGRALELARRPLRVIADCVAPGRVIHVNGGLF